MIRPADLNDIDDLVILAKSMQRHMGIEPAHEDLLRAMVESCIHDGFVFISIVDKIPTGFIGAVVEYSALLQQTIVREVAWFDAANQGGRLLKAFTNKAKAVGASSIVFSVLETAGDNVHAGMRRLGFEQVERTYRMTI